MLWFRTSGRACMTMSSASQLPWKSGINTSIVTSGRRARVSAMQAANCVAPWSGRSARVTDVITVWARPSWTTASASRAGSSGSGGPASPCGTAQNVHFRVQTSPRIMNVAVPRPQHSPMFGQRALSHTVWRPESTGFMREIVSALLRRTLSHSGRRSGSGWTSGACDTGDPRADGGADRGVPGADARHHTARPAGLTGPPTGRNIEAPSPFGDWTMRPPMPLAFFLVFVAVAAGDANSAAPPLERTLGLVPAGCWESGPGQPGVPMGKVIVDYTHAPVDLNAVTDGAGGAFLTWRNRSGPTSWVTRVDNDGAIVPPWPAAGIPVAGGSPVAVADGSGGVFVITGCWSTTG